MKALMHSVDEDSGRTEPVGFITPKLYGLKSFANALRDIIDGDNGVNKVSGCNAGTGWDACTGFGGRGNASAARSGSRCNEITRAQMELA